MTAVSSQINKSFTETIVTCARLGLLEKRREHLKEYCTTMPVTSFMYCVMFSKPKDYILMIFQNSI